MIFNLSETQTIASTFLAELRNIDIQKDSMRFRKNLERIGEILAYEASKKLHLHTIQVKTPLGEAETSQLIDQPILATILRAGLPMHQGFLNYFDKADSAFISAYRKHLHKDTFEINVQYLSSPSIDNKIFF